MPSSTNLDQPITDAQMVLNEYQEWDDARAAISEQESNGDYPSASTWANSDDDGIAILHNAIPVLQELLEILTSQKNITTS